MKTVKRSPLVMITNLILTDAAVLALYFIVAIIYRYFDLKSFDLFAANSMIQFDLLTISLFFVFQIVLFVLVFLAWYYETYQITKNAFIHRKGIIMKQRKIIPLEKVELIESKQSPLGKLFKYGTIIIKNNLNSDGVKFSFFPEPEKHVKVLRGKKGKEQEEDDSIKNSENNVDNPGIDELLTKREDREIEFKASMRWDKKQSKVNKSLEKAVMKTLAGFMNSKGGYLLIGVNDDGTIHGIEKDYRSLPKKNIDGFENHFNQVFNEMLGVENIQFCNITFHKKKKKTICLITVIPSYTPVYLNFHDKEEFFVRAGNSTSPLSLRQATSYIKNNWK